MASRRDLYIGKAGQMAVMAEFLLRGYNVAVPEVDVGDDVLVVEDESGEVSRIQVKTSVAQGSKRRAAWVARFRISLEQLQVPRTPPLFYVLAVRIQESWDFLVFSQVELYRLHSDAGVGSPTRGHVVVRLVLKETDVRGYGLSFQEYRNDWDRYWPIIEHRPLLE